MTADGKRKISDFPGKYAALGRALVLANDRQEPWQAIEAIKLIALTGMRRGEAIGLQWSEMNMSGSCLQLADGKTGESVRPLSRSAANILESIRLRGEGGMYVFPADRKEASAYGGLPKAFIRIKDHPDLSIVERDTLSDFTMHGLRHGFATTADGLGLTLPTVAALLGHSAGGVTAGYIARVDAVLSAAADKVADEVVKMLAQTPESETLPHQRFGARS